MLRCSIFASRFCLVLLVAGCAPSLTLVGAQIREAAPEGVSSSAFLGTVVGNVGPFDQSAIDDAKTDALNRGAERGQPTSSG
jgi:hypothetical protein